MICFEVSLILYGMSTLQVGNFANTSDSDLSYAQYLQSYWYFLRYEKDSIYLKLLVSMSG